MEIFSEDRETVIQVVSKDKAVGNRLLVGEVIYELETYLEIDGEFRIYKYRKA